MSTDGEGDTTMMDNEGEEDKSMASDDMDAKYPNRPRNHSATLPFHELITLFFVPLQQNKHKPKGPVLNRKKIGPHAQSTSVNDIRANIIKSFIDKWKKQVGSDIYPAFRLIMPDKDRDRAMYGLKEMSLGKLIVRMLKITKDSDDAKSLTNWKYGNKATMAGDFAGRCYEVIKQRPFRSDFGKLTIGDVNEMLDELSAAQREEHQLPIMERFYKQMNPEELLWLIRMILRQMKIGATEKTILEIWHKDADTLFNVSSSLRRVCWELHDKDISLSDDQSGLTLMQCFQPQLAAFQMRSMEKMVEKMKLSEEDPVFWIEEKLDGERMQLHMVEDDSKSGGKRFGFWSRKAKDYAYLYGDSFDDPHGALTQYLKGAFHEGVRNIILDGEMMTWDPSEKTYVPFGHLKTAALNEQKNQYANGTRPFLVVFDCLYLNDKPLTGFPLRKRREALEKSLIDVEKRIEKHTYTEACTAAEIEPILRKCVEDSAEGLVAEGLLLKNPRSIYQLNTRNDDWMKVKPEYMTEFGDNLDCIVIGGYYGTGKRGGMLSSFLCGLKPSANQLLQDDFTPTTCVSFFKVGGGISAGDYQEIRHLTDGKWIPWNVKNPPSEIKLGGGTARQYERPDMWIKAEESIVFEVKAASVHHTDQFAFGATLRFPRFKRIRKDKDFHSALSVDEFKLLNERAKEEKAEKQFQIDDARRKKRSTKRTRRQMVVAGQDEQIHAFAGPKTSIFGDMSFFVLSELLKPKTSKADLEAMIKANGGRIVQTERDEKTIVISDRNVVKAAAIKKTGKRLVIRPKWLYDCIRQAEADIGHDPYILPYEPSHILSGPDEQVRKLERNLDRFNDSYTRDVTVAELMVQLDSMNGDDLDIESGSESLAEIRQLLEAS